MYKRILAGILSLCTAASLVACQNNESSNISDSADMESSSPQVQTSSGTDSIGLQAPDYVNLDSPLPFVKEDSGEKVTLTIMAGAQDGAKDVENTWQWVYLQDKGNIELDITLVQWASKEEKKNLALSTGIIPDIMYNMQLVASDLVNYGSNEHILTDMTDLIENFAPDIQMAMEMYPENRATWTTPDGAIYSLSNIGDASPVSNYSMWINTDWLHGIGMESTPETLDEFTEILIQFKEKNPMNVAKENLVPLGGYSGADYPTAFILQALGFQINSFRSERIYDYAVIGDHCSVICCDDMYAHYLEIARDWYEKGLISQDYFTVDWKTTRAQAGYGYCGAYPQYTMSTIISNGFMEDEDGSWLEKWVACPPLTSQWNDTPVVKGENGTSIGNFVISEECQNKEVAIRLANWFFTKEGSLLKKYGPMKGSDVDTYGLLDGWYIEPNEQQNNVLQVNENPQLSIYSSYECLGYTSYYKEIGNSGTSLIAYLYELGGYKDQYTKEGEFDMTSASGRVGKQRYDAVAKYAVDGAPSILYFDAKTSARIADLTAVISSYATTQTANFITGKRDISEVNDYLEEIRASGGDELNEIYNNAYQEYLNSLK